MKTLHKLADWISGGKITRLTKELAKERQALVQVRRSNAEFAKLSANTEAENIVLRDGLDLIIAAQTPSCAGIGRKMASIAHETLARADASEGFEPVKVAA